MVDRSLQVEISRHIYRYTPLLSAWLAVRGERLHFQVGASETELAHDVPHRISHTTSGDQKSSRESHAPRAQHESRSPTKVVAVPRERRDPLCVTVGTWPETDDELIGVQENLASEVREVLASAPWRPDADPLLGGCFVAFAGHPGDGPQFDDRAWASAVAWRPRASPYQRGGERYRKTDRALSGRTGVPRRARDIEAQVVVSGRVAAPYRPGLLALRQGPMLAKAVSRLHLVPDVLLVDATGLDHPRGAGLAVQLGAVVDLPTVGVTDRPLLGTGDPPMPVRSARSPVLLDGVVVGFWVTTRTGARPILAHAAWRTSPEIAAEVVLLASTQAARTPVPLQEARRVAREARASQVSS